MPNPLYLRALLDELRVWGDHETLGARIAHYLSAPTVDSLFELILARYEADYERDRPGLVGDAFSLLWAARRGLSETELLELLGTSLASPLPRAFWSPLYLAAEQSLTNRSGLLDFFHDFLRLAVEHRYLGTAERQAAHLRLADYFAAREIGPRKVDELPWQLARAGAWQRLFELLSDADFVAAAQAIDAFEVKAAWVRLEAGSRYRMADAYRRVIDDPESTSAGSAGALLTSAARDRPLRRGPAS